jgi:dihydrofolate synthase/folylpolyglutamate synthase
MDPIGLLLARDQHGVKFGLENIRAICAALDHPELACPTLLVAGTNGKGSVTAIAAAAFTAAGYRTGRYTSPHLLGIDERFVIDGRVIDRAVLGEAAAGVIEAEAAALRGGTLSAPATFFEIVTATAFEVFRRQRVAIAVLEVGMGGRFDATNVADPLAGAITSIALDHERFLGYTLAEIAFEKAGVLRRDRPVVTGPLPPEAEEVIRRVARERGAHVVDALADVEVAATLTGGGRSEIRLRTSLCDYGTITLALRGRHQVVNAVVAVRLVEAASAAGMPVARRAVVEALEEVSWPGRLQEVRLRGGGRVLLDAAHNPAGAATLAGYLSDVGAPPAPIVFGAMRDKDIAGMLRALAPQASSFVFTEPHSHRSAPATELAAEAARVTPGIPARSVSPPVAAVELALRQASFIVVAGSIFLIGDVLPWLDAHAIAEHTGPSTACGILRDRQR